MADKSNMSDGSSKENKPDEQVLAVLDRVQELTWALLDEGITDDEFSLLDTLLLSDDRAREAYVECVQLHTDLLGYYDAPKNAVGSKSPVLSFLETGSSVELPRTPNVN